MFNAGLLDDEFDTFCATLNTMMYCMLVFVSTLMVIQFIASMVYICPRHHTYSEEDVMSPVIIMVQCYNKGNNELRKPMKSVLDPTYHDENKILFMVADGLVTGTATTVPPPSTWPTSSASTSTSSRTTPSSTTALASTTPRTAQGSTTE